jgi:diguanylate cyclase (GGDEF)-like protein
MIGILSRRQGRRRTAGAELRSRHLLATCTTFGSILLFVAIWSNALPAFVRESRLASGEQVLATILLLNIALILFGWRRSKDLKLALHAHAEAERRAYESAFLDHVTGLPNRRELVQLIADFIARESGSASLLYLDLDHFKKVNDLYTHAAGDRLLRFVADSLKASVPPDACCARLGGDEFAIFLPGRHSEEEVEAVASAILRRLDQPITLDATIAHVSASIGIAMLGEGCQDGETLLRRGDIAMYEAKRLGRDRFIRFEPELEDHLNRRNQVEAEIRAGIVNGEFIPFYQSIVDLQSGELKGFEVLARWQHPQRGLLEPPDFIDIAEASTLIASLSYGVIRQAMVEARHWPAPLCLAVNISPVQFKDPLLAQRIVQLLTETGFPAGRLEIEITESALMEDRDLALATVQSLKNLGISISLDDFGTGYASLAQLKALPFDRIKIDRSFVTTLLDDEHSNAIVNTVAHLGQALRLPITVEGVESDEVRAQLQSIGCSDAQGWLFGKAVCGQDVRALLGGAGGEATPDAEAPRGTGAARRPAA